MEIKFIVTKEERKALVKAIGEIVGCTPVYKGAPSFAFAVNNYIIDRHGTLTYDEQTDVEGVRRLLLELTAQGFVHEDIEATVGLTVDYIEVAGNLAVSETHEHSTALPEGSFSERTSIDGVVEVPLAGFTSTALDNLERLVSGKAALIMKAIGADVLPIERTETSLCFPWFSVSATDMEADAHYRFVHALCEMAKKQKRVTMKDKVQDGGTSEKFAFRCFLLRLGFIGKEYAPARKVLLSKLSGNSSFKSGDHKSRDASGGTMAANNGEESVEVVAAHDNNADDVPQGIEVTVHE